jgi:Fatty acid synthesis protein
LMRRRIPSPSRGCRAFGFRASAGIVGRLGADSWQLEAVLMRIAIDAMGGDHGPGSIIDGALVAARHLQIGLLLVGARAVVDAELRRHPGATALDIETLDAPEWVEMAEPAAAALRRKP